MGPADELDVDLESLTPLAWRLLRVAAGYEQRAVEKELDTIMQAHVSMLENNSRSLSHDRLEQLFTLYTDRLEPDQVRAIVENF